MVLTISSCGAAAPGALTQSDIPGYLGLHENRIAEAGLLRSAHPGRLCHGASVSVAAFTAPGQNLSSIFDKDTLSHDQVLSDVVMCPHATSVSAVFRNNLKQAHPVELVEGIGQRAFLSTLDPEARSFSIEWLNGSMLGYLVLQGPSNDSRITVALTAMLARRAVEAS